MATFALRYVPYFLYGPLYPYIPVRNCFLNRYLQVNGKLSFSISSSLEGKKQDFSRHFLKLAVCDAELWTRGGLLSQLGHSTCRLTESRQEVQYVPNLE